jgi:ParB family transcriptional regulator, chromosome partitioning protein
VEEAARQHNAGQAAATAAAAGSKAAGAGPAHRLRPPGLLELEELLSAHLDTRVNVSMGGSKGAKGKVTIEFANLEDLERIYRAMTPARVPPD